MYINLIYNRTYSKLVFNDGDAIEPMISKLNAALEKKPFEISFEISFRISEASSKHIFHGKFVNQVPRSFCQTVICNVSKEFFKKTSQIEKCWFVLCYNSSIPLRI